METKSLEQIFEVAKLFQWQNIVLLVFGFAVLIYLVRIINHSTAYLNTKYPSKRILLLQISTIIVFLIYIFGGFFLIYSTLHPPRELMLALGGSAAVAIGFAFKDIAASLIAGLIILFDRPFQVGDRVTFGNVYGEIKSITLRTVRLVTLDDNLVTIPNSKFINEYVASGNAGALDMMVVIDFHTALSVDVEQVKALLHEIAVTSRFAYLKKPISIVVSEVAIAERLALRFSVKVYVLDVQYEKALQTDIVTRASTYFNKKGIERPAVS